MGWREALDVLHRHATDGWAVTGSAALALHGLGVVPRDLDLAATADGAAAIERLLAAHVTTVHDSYEREGLAADRRVTLTLEGTPVEVLVEPWNPGASRMAFADAPTTTVDGFRVLCLEHLRTIYDATGQAEVVRAIDEHDRAR